MNPGTNASVGGDEAAKASQEGLLRFTHASLQANYDPALQLVIYAPAWVPLPG